MDAFDFTSVSDIPQISNRRRTNPTPSMMESILHNIAVSNAVQEADDFIRSIHSLQAEMARSIPARQAELQRQLEECHEAAKARFAHFEHLADLWRGAEFNLGQFLHRLQHGSRELTLRSAECEEEQRLIAEQAQQAQRIQHVQEAHVHSMQEMHIQQARETQEEWDRTMTTLATVTSEPPQQLPQELPQALAQQQLPTTIQELIARVDNEAQKQALGKLLLRNEANQIYLASYEANTVMRGRGSDVQGTFTVLGTIRNGTRDSYTVKWYRWTPTGHSFWCNCPDHKFNSARKNMVCKHICFLVTKVGRLLDPAFFDSQHRFTQEQHEAFQQSVGNAAIFADGARERERLAAIPAIPTITHRTYGVSAISREERRVQFMEVRRPICAEDSCPICYDELGNGACLNCPTCSNNVHRDCMEVWLERNKTCVFCRSDVWRAW